MSIVEIKFGKSINPELYAGVAESMAMQVSTRDSRDRDRKGRNKPTQLRRFYDELVMMHDKVEQNPDGFDDLLPFIKMIKAKVAYALGRGNVDYEYKTMMDKVIDGVTSREDLRQAKLFMEAFMGFYKVHGPSDKN